MFLDICLDKHIDFLFFVCSAKAIHVLITWTEHTSSSAQKQAAEAKVVSEILGLNPFECQVISCYLVTLNTKCCIVFAEN